MSKKEIMELLLNISTKHENDFRSIKKEIQQLKDIGPEKENKAIDCTWADWSSCNASCGGGKQVRSIEQPALHGGKNCTGEEVQDCNLNPCPIDCIWTDWSSCNASCGGGKQVRSIEQPALHGGKNCTGDEVQDCNSNPCPIDCTWTDWSRCNASCGGGKQFRTIEQPALHGGKLCQGLEIWDCNSNPCPIDCTWGEWSICTATCGQAIKFRSIKDQARDGGNACLGKSTQPCNLVPCPCPDISKLPTIVVESQKPNCKTLVSIIDALYGSEYEAYGDIENHGCCAIFKFVESHSLGKEEGHRLMLLDVCSSNWIKLIGDQTSGLPRGLFPEINTLRSFLYRCAQFYHGC